MPTDPRLQNIALLTLAAYRLQQRLQHQVPYWRHSEGLASLWRRREPCRSVAPGICPPSRRVVAWRGSWGRRGSGSRRWMVALDPRLASVHLLTLAAMRARQRAATQPAQVVVLQIEYDAYGDEPRSWASGMCSICRSKRRLLRPGIRATARFRDPPGPAPGGGAC